MSFVLREHTADVAVEATGETVDDVFAAVADGLAACMCDEFPGHGNRFEVAVTAERVDALLFDYLDELIYLRDVEGVLPVENEVTVTEGDESWHLIGAFRGIPLGDVTARDVKAVTYSQMVVEERDDGWYAYVVFDV